MTARFDHGYALLIGVGRLANWEEMSLPESVQDVRAIKETLADPRLCAYPDTEEHIREIHDESATRTGILEGLEWLMSRADQDPSATAVVYYSGHGMLDSHSSNYFLIPHDVDPSGIAGTAVAFQDFATEIRKVRAQRRLVVLDCCHAGALRGGKGGLRRDFPSRMEAASAPRSFLDQLKEGKGHAVFCSSEESESSWVLKGGNISIFTYHFLEALRGAASKAGETVVNLSHLMNHVGREVPKSAQAQWGKRQTPFFLFETQDYAVALLRGGKGLPSSAEFLQGIASTRSPGPEFGDYPELTRAYLSPWSVFERVKLDSFRGREWLEKRLDGFLSRYDRGLFILEAKAGLGKTAFLAHLARTRGYVHHFVELAPGPDGVARGLKSLTAQLIRAWGLAPEVLDAVGPVSSLRPDFLQNLLKQASDLRQQPDQKIVLVVDALDEAGPPAPGQNVLGLPRVLPAGVYLVVSHRPVDVSLTIEAPREIVRIDAQAANNLADMRAFLEEAADWPGVRKAREENENPVSRESFVATLLEKSQGVWIYLKYVLDEIERGPRSPLKLDELPQGLWEYYEKFWKQWKGTNIKRWRSFDLPFLSTLAAAQDDLTLENLLTLTGLGDRPKVARHFRDALDTWSPYLASSSGGPGSPKTYRFYHASLRDFFHGMLERAQLTHSEQSFAEELAEATRQAQSRMSDIFIRRWGGLDAGLPALSHRVGREQIDDYGLRHLAEHLEGAGRMADLHRLMRLERRVGEKGTGPARAENVWFTARERVGDTEGYVNDLARAARLVDVAGRPDLDTSHLAAHVGLGIRYALMSSSLNSLAATIPGTLIATLVEKGYWLPSQGLAYAQRVPDPGERVLLFIEISLHLEDREKESALRKALEAAREIECEDPRAEALAALVPHVTEPLLDSALEVARRIGDEVYRARVLAALAPRLAVLDRAEEALVLAMEIESGWRRAKALVALAPLLSESLRCRVVEAAYGIGDERLRAETLAELGRAEEALGLARGIGDEWDRAKVLAALAPRLAALGRAEEVLGMALGIGHEACRAEVLAALAPHLSESLLRGALEATRGIGLEVSRTQVLAAWRRDWRRWAAPRRHSGWRGRSSTSGH
ncbi:MAG: caspase family protein [Isosphaerales bacterium]